MDPYLERHWRDVHHRLCTYACDSIQEQLSEDLRARVDERLVVESALDSMREMYPDIRVFQKNAPPAPPSSSTSAAVVEPAQPLVLIIPSERAREGYIEIIDVTSGCKVISVIEFLSPTNKTTTDGRRQYRAKQRELRKSLVSLVEIDLTRAGRRRLMVPQDEIPAFYRTTYQTCVFRGYKPTHREIYRMPLQERLPTIRIPLRQTDPDAVLDLQALIDLCYQKGRYDDMDYTKPPVPPLDAESADWARNRVAQAGKR